jgi:hypothetical protein
MSRAFLTTGSSSVSFWLDGLVGLLGQRLAVVVEFE